MAIGHKSIAVVGSGWAGATTARTLHDAGLKVEVYEAASSVGGHSRSEWLNGVLYEPNGAHIFHTSNERVVQFVDRFGLRRPYEHKVVAAVPIEGEGICHLSWPPQVSELEGLPQWPTIKREIAALPETASGEDFESYVISLMGPTLYQLFIRDYTLKQWGMDPSELSSSFAPKRVELRTDGYKRLFRDAWEFYPPNGVNEIIEAVLRPIALTCGAEITAKDLPDLERQHSAVVLTAPLDKFLDEDGLLEWRGIAMRSRYVPTDPNGTETAAYVVNYPSLDVPYTRTVESKHASGQVIAGTVVSKEYPGAPARHYPVSTVDGRNERVNLEFKARIAAMSGMPIHFCGRLANYQYINQDEAIVQGLTCAASILETF